MTSEPHERDEWTILRVDPTSGELLEPDEEAFRRRIREEAEQGLVGVDGLYFSVHSAIHQPLVGEQGRVAGDAWLLQRANRTTLRIPIGNSTDSPTQENVAVTIARAAIDDFAAEVMMHLFAVANDPPNWRRPDFTVRLSALLDRLSFRRDERGVHRSDNRRRLARTILALHLTHIGVQREAGRGGRSVGFIAPLLSAVGYATHEDVRHLSPIDVFEQGLPEEVSISVNPLWYAGLRQPTGLPGQDYTLIPRPALVGKHGRKRGGSRSRTADVLREYILRCRAATEETRVVITRRALLDITSVSDRNVTQAARTLTRALDALCADGTLRSYSPIPLPLGSTDLITLHWTAS